LIGSGQNQNLASPKTFDQRRLLPCMRASCLEKNREHKVFHCSVTYDLIATMYYFDWTRND